MMMMMRKWTAPATHCNGLSIPQGHPEEDQEDEEDGGEDGRQWIVPDGDGHGHDDESLIMLVIKKLRYRTHALYMNIARS